MTMPRRVMDETLDHLAEDDPRAVRSRRDLQRVHLAMGTQRILRRGLRSIAADHQGAPLQILELGAGDGTLMLGVAQARLPFLAHAELAMLDRQSLVSDGTITRYSEAGWKASVQIVDVLDWTRASFKQSRRWDLIVANLFMHHFECSELAVLLRAIEGRCDRFLACEPRRSWPALAGSHVVGLLGANAVTRQDAVLSVHAGFRGQELSDAWPGPPGVWTLREHAAGAFSHFFSARRIKVD